MTGTGFEDSQLPPDPGGFTTQPTLPIVTRMGIEISLPKDWQVFQRNCTLLFQAELKDPNAQEYGRSGQGQRGIDILGRRGGGGEHFVGVQCKLIKQPLTQTQILSHAREALQIEAGLKELIFATSAPNSTKATDAALAVERQLKAEGHDLVVVVHGWDQLQLLIAQHERAYHAFHPAAAATTAIQAPGPVVGGAEFAALIAAQVAERLQAGVALPAKDAGADTDEDPALHARIDVFRDLLKQQALPVLAEAGLRDLLAKEDLSKKPWAAYRIQINLGSAAMELGQHQVAAERFEAGYALRPDDAHAKANLALARTLQGRYDEAMALARDALQGEARSDQAIGYLLQAAARADWAGEPESLIPEDLVGTVQADIGLAEFLRRRDVPGWAERTLEIALRHADAEEFRILAAVATLSLAVEGGDLIPGGFGRVGTDQLRQAADVLKARAEHALDVGFADPQDLMAYLNNAAVLLRLCERYAESEALLRRGLPRVGDQPQLRRLLALVQLSQDKDADACATLESDTDAENVILRAELQAQAGDLEGAIAAAAPFRDTELTPRLRRLKWYIIGHAAQRLGDFAGVAEAVAGLKAIDPADLTANVLEINAARRSPEDEAVAKARLSALAASVPETVDLTARYFLAVELLRHDLPEAASRLLDGRVDLSRPSPTTSVYLRSLASARRDQTFHAALDQAAPEVRDDPDTRWTVATHAWNRGDLAVSLSALEALLARAPHDGRARLLRVEILMRQDLAAELFSDLGRPIEHLRFERAEDRFRVATLLGHFGFVERAVAFAYRLFLQHRDLSRAWMTLAMIVLEEGWREGDAPPRWGMVEVGPHAAVDLVYADDSTAFFVVEPDAELRRLDPEAWEPDHRLVQAAAGLRTGAQFTAPDGRQAEIKQIRHKYVARTQFVLQNHEKRFPAIFGFKHIRLDPDQDGGFDDILAQLKAKDDWTREEATQYVSGPMSLGVLAQRMDMDTINVSAGLAADEVKLKVAFGSLEERDAATEAIRNNRRAGCVLDLLAFWTAWRLEALEAVVAACGPIHLPQSVLDRLRARREAFEGPSGNGFLSSRYDQGKMSVTEVSADDVAALHDETGRAIAWVDQNATIAAVLAGDELPEVLREHLRFGRGDMFDAAVLSHQSHLLLVSDDLPIREFGSAMNGVGGAWLHAVFGQSRWRGHIDEDQYVRWSAHLIGAGHSYLGVTGDMLARAARLDALVERAPGYLFRALSKMVGGVAAEPHSHIAAAAGCLRRLWRDPEAVAYREPTTGFLLRQLIRDRTKDYDAILRDLLRALRTLPGLVDYIEGWLRGYFLYSAVAGSPPSAGDNVRTQHRA